MLGYSSNEVASGIEAWHDLIHPEDREAVAKAQKAHLDGSTSFYEVEYRLRTKSGDWKWILSMGRVLEWQERNTPLRMTGTHMDIDSRKLAE